MDPSTTPRRPNESYTARYRREKGEAQPLRRPGAMHGRIVRAVVGGSIALVVALVWMVVELGVSRDEVLDALGTTLFFVALPVVLGILVGALWVGARAWRSRRR